MFFCKKKLSAKMTLIIISRLCLVPEISVTPPPKTPDPSPLPEEVFYFYTGDFWVLVSYIRDLLIPWYMYCTWYPLKSAPIQGFLPTGCWRALRWPFKGDTNSLKKKKLLWRISFLLLGFKKMLIYSRIVSKHNLFRSGAPLWFTLSVSLLVS